MPQLAFLGRVGGGFDSAALRSTNGNAKPGGDGFRLRCAALRSALDRLAQTNQQGWLSVSRWRSLPLGIATRPGPTLDRLAQPTNEGG